MRYEELKVGMRVKVVLPEKYVYCGVDFDLENDGCVGNITSIDNESCKTAVEVEFDDGHFDWGSYASLVSQDKTVDTETISDKLSQIEKLVIDIKDSPKGATHYHAGTGGYTWYRLEVCGQWLAYSEYMCKWHPHHHRVHHPVNTLTAIITEDVASMRMSDVKPAIVSTFRFNPDHIKNLIADRLDFDPKTVKISFNLDHNNSVKDIVIEVKE